MSEQAQSRSDRSRGRQLMRREFRAYTTGFVVALALTLVPFAIVNWHVMVPRSVYYLIGGFGLVQIVVHLRCFLHLNLKQRREDLALILFSTVLLILIVGGTLWIMWSLAARMVMPMHP